MRVLTFVEASVFLEWLTYRSVCYILDVPFVSHLITNNKICILRFVIIILIFVKVEVYLKALVYLFEMSLWCQKRKE